MKHLLAAVATPLLTAAAAVVGDLSFTQIAAAAIGTSPMAGLSLFMWSQERKERRDLFSGYVELTGKLAMLTEKTSDRLDRIERKTGIE